MAVGNKVTPNTMNWQGGLLTPYFSSLIPCKPLVSIKEHTCFPTGHKHEGKPARPGVEKPVALLGNDIIMYVYHYVFILFFINSFHRSYKQDELVPATLNTAK